MRFRVSHGSLWVEVVSPQGGHGSIPVLSVRRRLNPLRGARSAWRWARHGVIG